MFAATEDDEVPLDTIYQWQDACEEEIAINIIEGNHFFVHNERAVLIIRGKIYALLSALPNLQQFSKVIKLIESTEDEINCKQLI
mgnify:CR=1 FL=1